MSAVPAPPVPLDEASEDTASDEPASEVTASDDPASEVLASDEVGASDDGAAADVVAAGVVVLELSLLDPQAVSTRPAAAIAATTRVLPKRTMDSLLFLTARS